MSLEHARPSVLDPLACLKGSKLWRGSWLDFPGLWSSVSLVPSLNNEVWLSVPWDHDDSRQRKPLLSVVWRSLICWHCELCCMVRATWSSESFTLHSRVTSAFCASGKSWLQAFGHAVIISSVGASLQEKRTAREDGSFCLIGWRGIYLENKNGRCWNSFWKEGVWRQREPPGSTNLCVVSSWLGQKLEGRVVGSDDQ